MPTLLPLSPTRWINLDRVTMLEYDAGAWRVFFAGAEAWFTLDHDAGEALARYLLVEGPTWHTRTTPH